MTRTTRSKPTRTSKRRINDNQDRFRMVRIGDKCVTLEMPVLLDEDIQRYVISEHDRQQTAD